MRVLGLMSGTSADGVSAAVVETGPPFRVLEYRTCGYGRAVRRRILQLKDAKAGEICEANFWLGELFARAALRMRQGYDLIGSHGQTVFHVPGRSTLQLGEPCVIAERTGKTVVADFRPRDIAAGGEGAPLVPFFDRVLFGGRKRRAILNLGGIANATITDSWLAFDTGPGNCLLDEAVRRMGRGNFDRDGRLAASGRVDPKLLDRWLGHPYFRRRPPKSTGRELFDWTFVEERPSRDLVATLTLLTARTVSDAIRRWGGAGLQEVVVSGGGVYNRTLMEHLAALLWPAQVRSSLVFGLHPLAKEAAAFALLAAQTLRGNPGNVPAATGARRPVVLGKIVPGDNFSRLTRRRT